MRRRRRRGSFWLRAVVSFAVGEGVYYVLRSRFGISGDAAMLNAFIAGAGVYFILPWRRIAAGPRIWPEVEAAQPIPTLPPASGVPAPDVLPSKASPAPYEGARQTVAVPAPRRSPQPQPAPARSRNPKPRPLADEVGDILEEARIHMLELRLAAGRVEASRIRSDVEVICETSERLIARLAAGDRPRLLYASRIESTLATTQEVVASYLDMEGGKLFVEEKRKAKIRDTVESDFLPTIAEAFQHFARRLDEPEVIDLEAAIKAMTTRLKLEGL